MNLSQIRQDATKRLQQDQGGFSRLVFIHTAITVGASLLLLLISWLSTSLTPGGGLSNMASQDMLSTIQTMLQFAIAILSPIWEASLIFCALRLIRDQEYTTRDLTAGFRRWGAILGSLILRGLIYFGFSMACYFATSILVSFVPIPASVQKDLLAFVEAPAFPMAASLYYFVAVIGIIFAINLCLVLIPRVYLHRLVEYRIMDQSTCGGLQAILQSRILMKGHRRKLFLLDLSFWWYYLLEGAIAAFSLSYLFIPDLGMSLEIATWVFTLTSLLAQLALYYYAKPKLAISYALFYQNIFDESTKLPEPPQPQPLPEQPENTEE